MADHVTSYEFGATVKRLEKADADLRDQVSASIDRVFAGQVEFRSEVRESFVRVDRKQDQTNGRINDHDKRHDEFMKALSAHGAVLATLTANVKNLNHEVFERPRRDAGGLPPELLQKVTELLAKIDAQAGDNAPGITRRDIHTVVTVGRVVWALIGGLMGAGGLWLLVDALKGGG
jgi:hypothetical protein